MAQPRLIGELAVVALEAIPGNFRPFCVFKVANVAKRTKTDTRGGRNPMWDDQVNMPIPHGYSQMFVQVLNEDPQRGDQIICEGQIDLTKVLKEGEDDDWVPLSQRGKEAGDVYLELTFYSANPPPRRQPTRLVHPRPPHMGRGVSFPRPPMPSQYPARPRPPMPPPPGTAPGPTVHMSPAPRPLPPQPPVSFSGPPPHPSHRPPQPQPMNQPGGFAAPPPPPPPATTTSQPPIYARPAPLPASVVQPSPVTPPSSASASSVSVGNTWRTSSIPSTTKPQPFSPQTTAAYHPGPPGPPPPPMSQGAPLLSSPYRPVAPNQRPPYPNGGAYSPASHPGKPLPNFPPEHYHQPVPHPMPPPQQPMYPPQPSGAGYPPRPPPGPGYPPQPGYPPY
ncbi:hypothetical protein O0I10_001767 [Lichtheimia ornata]|uniref:C2 domain-containing protein n=1 Tax=Lichtheimia ornata TaxID=688661 RepID=A0AAD7Y2S0_9FUNG|nr:uncharacterized protein O0I10_001767 [Lichtheimia ornata]KAJ8662077.1 hypothetical protein O0I10_001767 [Lichtheimia ornata]